MEYAYRENLYASCSCSENMDKMCVLYQLCWELSWIFKRFIKILGSLNVVVMLESELFTVTSTPSVFTSEVKEQVCWVTFLSPKAHLKKKLYLFI